MREHLVGPWGTYDETTDSVSLDVGALVRRLLLFEHLTLESTRLKEVPLLVRAFGLDGVRELLGSGVTSIYCDAVTVGQIGQAEVLESRAAKGLLPLGSYSFSALVPHDRRDYIHRCFAEVEGSLGLGNRQTIKLKALIADRLTKALVTGVPTVEGLEADLEANHPVVRHAVALALSRHVGRIVSPDDFELRIDRVDDTDFRTETDVAARFGLEVEETHKIVGRGLLGVGGLNRRIEVMRAFDALSGLDDDELPIFESKLSFLAEQLDPAAHEARFDRVLRVAELPLPEQRATDVDLHRVLEIRDSDDCREMRQWLRSTDALTDEELHDSFHRIREQLSRTFHSGKGRAARLALGTGLGAIPGAGLVVGAAFSVLDAFLSEMVVPEPGPYSFLSHDYPSIFKGT